MFEVGLIHTPLDGHVSISSKLFELLKGYMVLHTPVHIPMFLSDLLFSNFLLKKKRKSYREKHALLHACVVNRVAWVMGTNMAHNTIVYGH